MKDFMIYGTGQNGTPGNTYLLQPMTPDARKWMKKNIASDSIFCGDGLVIEHRYVSDIIGGALDDGLTMERG